MDQERKDEPEDALWAEISPFTPRIDEGKYQATVKDVSVEWNTLTKYGYSDLVKFQFQVDDTPLNHLVYCKAKDPGVLNLRCKKLREAVTNILGREPDGKLNLKDLVGKPCEVWIMHVAGNDGNVFERVDKIRPAKV